MLNHLYVVMIKSIYMSVSRGVWDERLRLVANVRLLFRFASFRERIGLDVVQLRILPLILHQLVVGSGLCDFPILHASGSDRSALQPQPLDENGGTYMIMSANLVKCPKR